MTTLTKSPPQSANENHLGPQLPSIAELGADLLTTTPWQRQWALTRPFLLVIGFAVAWQAGWWWLTPLVMFLLFVAIVTVTHDVVHGSLGLSDRQTEAWLFLLGALLLESGHAYRTTHHQHHRVFPGPDDPEGDPLPHHGYGDTSLTQTGTLRGVIIPRLFLELTYHLEHHLYPAVPSHHLTQLSQRLEPALLANGVIPRRVP